MSASSKLFLDIREMSGEDYDVVSSADYGMMEYIESLIDQSTLETMEKVNIRMNLPFIEWNYQAHKLISYLKQYQPDPILSGNNYNQTDILNHLKKL